MICSRRQGIAALRQRHVYAHADLARPHGYQPVIPPEQIIVISPAGSEFQKASTSTTSSSDQLYTHKVDFSTLPSTLWVSSSTVCTLGGAAVYWLRGLLELALFGGKLFDDLLGRDGGSG